MYSNAKIFLPEIPAGFIFTELVNQIKGEHQGQTGLDYSGLANLATPDFQAHPMVANMAQGRCGVL